MLDGSQLTRELCGDAAGGFSRIGFELFRGPSHLSPLNRPSALAAVTLVSGFWLLQQIDDTSRLVRLTEGIVAGRPRQPRWMNWFDRHGVGSLAVVQIKTLLSRGGAVTRARHESGDHQDCEELGRENASSHVSPITFALSRARESSLVQATPSF